MYIRSVFNVCHLVRRCTEGYIRWSDWPTNLTVSYNKCSVILEYLEEDGIIILGLKCIGVGTAGKEAKE